jgi:hypothetical protein
VHIFSIDCVGEYDDEQRATRVRQGIGRRQSEPAGLLDSVGWAFFFIWVGVAILANVPWGWFFIGVAVLILASQFARRLMGLEIEGFRVALRGGVYRRWPVDALKSTLAAGPAIADPAWSDDARQSRYWLQTLTRGLFTASRRSSIGPIVIFAGASRRRVRN